MYLWFNGKSRLGKIERERKREKERERQLAFLNKRHPETNAGDKANMHSFLVSMADVLPVLDNEAESPQHLIST